MKITPGAGEATATFAAPVDPTDPDEDQGDDAIAPSLDSEAKDPERAEYEADRRARATVRRYCTANNCDKLWTLTYAEAPATWDEVWRDIENFRRRLWRHLDRKMPMVSVIEAGTKNGRLHVHCAVPEFFPKADLEHLWGHGWVDMRRVEPKTKRAEGSKWERSRIVASYLSAYLGGKKANAAAGRARNGKRYSTTRGFTPQAITVEVDTLDDAQAVIAEWFEGEPIWSWNSEEQGEDWQGPPAWCGFW